MHRVATADELLTRGVWLAPYLFDGCEVLIAVDSRGGVRKHVKLREGVDEVRAIAWLEQLLDRIDPVLQLVKPETPPSPPRVDPRLYEDRLSFALRLAKQDARNISRIQDCFTRPAYRSS